MPKIHRGKEGFYIGTSEENHLAEIHFVQTEDNQLIIDYTFVSDELRGDGIGEMLVAKAVQYAREMDQKIVPLCPFAKQQIESHPQYHDVLF